MGIKSFFKVQINKGEFKGKTLANLGQETTLAKLKNKTICIDAFNMIYSAILAFKTINTLTDKEGNTTAHIKTILSQILMFKKANINQIWIFENKKQSALKNHELARRKERRDKSDDEKVKFKITETHINDIKNLLDLMGIVYIVTPPEIEGEQFGAYLTIPKPGIGAMCDYVYSRDADVLIFGGNLLMPDFVKSSTGKSKKRIYKAFNLNDILNVTGLDREQLATMAVALGCDFSEEKVKGIGPKTAIKLAEADEIILTDDQIKAKKYFLSDITDMPEIFQPVGNKEMLINWLVSKNFNKEKLMQTLN